jgi:endonuclease/exonuclease/phosphatase family metal-dependent hydrolase
MHLVLRIVPFFLISLLSGVLAVMPGWVRAEEQSPVNEASSVGIAVFNMAWAGTIEDFKRHLEVCSTPEVNWCAARSRTSRGASHSDAEEEVRAALCQKQFIAAAGGLDAAMMVAPCTAYGSRKHPALAETIESYDLKLEGLRATVEKLIEAHGIHVIAFQEVKSQEVVRHVLGKFSGQFEICVAPHSTFQTVAFAWDKSMFTGEYTCTPHQDLAIAEHTGEKYRRVRPGLALELMVNGLPVTFMNIHLKSGCANLNSSSRWPGRRLTDPDPACAVLNRQVPILEDWIEQVASRSPRFILLGDFNRRIDQEAKARIARARVRTDGSDPAAVNIKDEAGGVKSDYLWQEIADGFPPMYQVYLKSPEPGCKGLPGLDHIVVSGPIKWAQRGPLHSSKIVPVKRSRQPIPTSDHCPTIATLEL